jgi:hypothetical protein
MFEADFATDHVTLPFDYYLELMSASEMPAPLKPFSYRVMTIVQTTIICAAISGAVAAASYGYASAIDRLETKSHARAMRLEEAKRVTAAHQKQ